MVTRDPDPQTRERAATCMRWVTTYVPGLYELERGICPLQRIVIPEEITVTVDGGRLRGPDKRYTHQCMQVPS